MVLLEFTFFILVYSSGLVTMLKEKTLVFTCGDPFTCDFIWVTKLKINI